jgi:carboxyl-terminal processing protease
MKRLIISTVALLLLVPSVAPFAEARSLQSFVVAESFDLAPSVLVAQVGASTINRADFLVEIVDEFYGRLEKQYSAPFEGVPDHAKNAIGLVRLAGGLGAWGAENQWSRSVSRGEALEVIFTLGDLHAGAKGPDKFRDVRGRNSQRLAYQSLVWNLIAPLRSNYFGWSRALKAEELNPLLSRVSEHLELPLPLPQGGVKPRQDLRKSGTRRSPRERQAPSRSGRGITQPEKTIKIDRASVDPGRSVRKTRSKALPRRDLIETIWGLIQDRFLYQDRIDDTETTYAIIEKMMSLLEDPYTVFQRPVIADAFTKRLQGEKFFGIGAQVRGHEKGGVEIVTPLEGSPAIRAGLKPGDRIIAVDGKDITDILLGAAVQLIRGPEGESVQLTIEREGTGGKMLITIIRAVINMQEVAVSVQDEVGIVKLTQFGAKTMQEITGKLKGLVDQNVKGLIIDVRNNPGGLLNVAIEVVSNFSPENAVVVIIESRTSTREDRAYANHWKFPEDIPVVVFINKGSASASEIVAGALQDYGRATIMGQTTFGKGSVQEVASITTGEQVKMTVAEYLTPNANKVNKIGIKPDIELEPQEYGKRDDWLVEAIRYVKNKR